jgi:phosphoglycolate phosphatase-like HAD superfamily hydrolase
MQTTLPEREPAEIIRPFEPRPDISHVIFDFDGTLSWLRHGWPRIMLDLFLEFYPSTAASRSEIEQLLLDDILGLNGKPTIFQMQRFVERVAAKGGKCPAPEALLNTYQDRLDLAIALRTQEIRTKTAATDHYVVHGARALLNDLKERGLTLIILSGTIEHRVKEEAEILGLTPYFGSHIYGGTVDPGQFSKKAVIDRLLREERIEGRHLLSFGDGPVEIFHTQEIGGLAVGVPSDEDLNGSGVGDVHKKKQLIEAGAHMLTPDYHDLQQLVRLIFGN